MNKHHKKLYISALLGCVMFLSVVGLSLTFGTDVLAQVQEGDTFGIAAVDEGVQLGARDIRVTIARIIRAALGFLGIIAVGIMLYGGYVYMTAGGSEEKVATAKKILINGTIGLAIIMSSFAITHFVLSRLSEATGSGTVPCIGEDCEDGGGGGGLTTIVPTSCTDKTDLFAVESITPNQEKTGMNNVVIRAIFTKQVASEAKDVFEIRRDNNLLDNSFDFKFANPEKTIVEATPKEGVCKDGSKGCLLGGSDKSVNYNVKVKKTVKTKGGAGLQNEELAKKCPNLGLEALLNNGATFNVDKLENDVAKPEVT